MCVCEHKWGEWQGERESSQVDSLPSTEPDVGLDPMTPDSKIMP